MSFLDFKQRKEDCEEDLIFLYFILLCRSVNKYHEFLQIQSCKKILDSTEHFDLATNYHRSQNHPDNLKGFFDFRQKYHPLIRQIALLI